MSVDEIKSNLIDVLMDKYAYCNNTRGNEYAVYDDFESRFIKSSSEEDVLSAFFDAILSIPSEKVAGLLWLVSAYNIHLHKIIPKMLPMITSSDKKVKLLEFVVKRIDLWPEGEFSTYSDRDKKLVLDELRKNNLSFSDKVSGVLSG